ncbi:hypothetical protein HNR55_000178 [Acetobacter lovaniensis]|uniref:Uncharacterized protein n=1 Tax=Acetobacter lovaniensis TaxID=104100 RepID=A0A841QBQ4_9PROT|nr:hypothetical protein [Acetobacter lovaniensis]
MSASIVGGLDLFPAQAGSGADAPMFWPDQVGWSQV